MEARLGLVLREDPAVIVSVLENLSAREIAKCLPVCRSWKLYGGKILEGRRRIHSHPIVVENTDTVIDEMREYLERLPIVPRVALFFRGSEVTNETVWSSGSCENELLLLRKSLNPNCVVWAIVDHPIRHSRLISDVISSAQFACLDSLIFPTLPVGAHLICFCLSHDMYRNEVEGRQLSRAELNNLFTIPDQLPVRCLLLFRQLIIDINNLCTSFWHREGGQIALCGADVLNSCSVQPGSNHPSRDWFGLAFCGPNVSASSVVIDHSEDAAAKLQLLQEHVNSLQVHPKQMFAFLFAAGCVLEEKLQLQCQQFQEMFGQTPLTKVRTYGNHGHDYSPTRSVPPQPPNWRLDQKCMVFVLVAIN